MKKLRSRGVPMRAIAQAVGRSISTVAAWTSKVWDNRKQKPTLREEGRVTWMRQNTILKLKCALYIKGITQTLGEALDCRSVPLPAIEYLNENTGDDEALDPS